MDGSTLELPVGKTVCVGRNYVDHAKEMGNQVPGEPMLFIKPASALTPLAEPIVLPAFSTDVHHELEMAVLIGKRLRRAEPDEAGRAVEGVGVAIDLTARDLQARLKQQGHPWEKAKGFDGACPLSPFVDATDFPDLQDVDIRLTVNGEVRQAGNTRDMVFPTAELLAHTSEYFTLEPGDVVLTGTPAGVAALKPGDVVLVELGASHRFSTRVAAG